eukprot:757501-Hanusia_phi.AAC.3
MNTRRKQEDDQQPLACNRFEEGAERYTGWSRLRRIGAQSGGDAEGGCGGQTLASTGRYIRFEGYSTRGGGHQTFLEKGRVDGGRTKTALVSELCSGEGNEVQAGKARQGWVSYITPQLKIHSVGALGESNLEG